ncbi:hypothetical protein Hdeb2414_s0813g00949931 [Helianthus debilis subsp. tardiflorus]
MFPQFKRPTTNVWWWLTMARRMREGEREREKSFSDGFHRDGATGASMWTAEEWRWQQRKQ